MLCFNPIQLAYGIMMIGMVFCIIISKKQKKSLREASDRFALSFTELANYIIPIPPRGTLSFRTDSGGRVSILPISSQPREIQEIIVRANDEKSVVLFSQMTDAYAELERLSGFNRTARRQFCNPLQEILIVTHTFLTGCENTAVIDTKEKLGQYKSFLKNQLSFRMTLLRRISRSFSEKYRELNQLYLPEMMAEEQKNRIRTSAYNKGGRK